MKKIFKTVFGTLLLLVVVLYLGTVFLLPQVINNKVTVNKLQSLIHNKTGLETNISGLNLKISPLLIVSLNVDDINAKKDNVQIADIKNLSAVYKLLRKKPALISADNIFIDGNALKQLKKDDKDKKKKKGNFEPKYIPEIHIKNLVFKYDEININAENINAENNVIKLKVTANAPFLKEPIKAGESGFFSVAGNELKANEFKTSFGNSNLYIDGLLIDNNKSPDFTIKGENLPMSELVPAVLHFQKAKEPCKKFIENIKVNEVNGTVNVDLKVNKDGIWGTSVANDYTAHTVLFNIPIYFKEAVFNFNGKRAESVAEGIFGNEKVTHTLNITDLGTPEQLIAGKVHSRLTKKFRYVPNLTILNGINIDVAYNVKDKKPDVYYDVEILPGADMIFGSFYFGLRDYKRKIHANTFKDGNDIYLKEYKYSYSTPRKENAVVFGNGLFSKNKDKKDPDKYIPQFLTVRTSEYAPVSVIGSFGEKVRGGEFKGDLRYDFVNNKVDGTFDIIKAGYNDFHIDNAHIVSKNGVFKITTDGLYNGEKYKAELSCKNNIYGETYVYNLKLFLDKLILKTTPETKEPAKKHAETQSQDKSKNINTSEITVNNWEIAINEIKRDKFILQNVKLLGNMKNNIFNFTMKELNFADGIIKANGFYDFTKDKSKMTFEAKNINSDKAANMMLNLENQIEGTATAKVDIDAKNMFSDLDAHCEFEVKEGFMPKFGSTEFKIKDKTYKLENITNVDLTQKELMKDDIKGTFDVHNTELNNLNITTWHELSSVYIEGNYEMEKQYADLQAFWHYSKEAPKGARIFGIPFSWILKFVFRPEHSREMYKSQLAKIPPIISDEKNSNYYRIHLKGDINKNQTELVMKEIK